VSVLRFGIDERVETEDSFIISILDCFDMENNDMRILSVYQTNFAPRGLLSIVLETPVSSVSNGWGASGATRVETRVFGEISCQRGHSDGRLFGRYTGSVRPDDGRLHSSACDAILTLFCPLKRGADCPSEASIG